MSLKTSASCKNKSNEIKTKMKITRKIIRNKFKEAYANRIAHENNQVIQTIPMDSSNEATSQTIVKQSRPMTTKVVDNMSFNNVNELCDRLRTSLSHMTSTKPTDIDEMNAIIMKLRELKILA